MPHHQQLLRPARVSRNRTHARGRPSAAGTVRSRPEPARQTCMQLKRCRGVLREARQGCCARAADPAMPSTRAAVQTTAPPVSWGVRPTTPSYAPGPPSRAHSALVPTLADRVQPKGLASPASTFVYLIFARALRHLWLMARHAGSHHSDLGRRAEVSRRRRTLIGPSPALAQSPSGAQQQSSECKESRLPGMSRTPAAAVTASLSLKNPDLQTLVKIAKGPRDQRPPIRPSPTFRPIIPPYRPRKPAQNGRCDELHASDPLVFQFPPVLQRHPGFTSPTSPASPRIVGAHPYMACQPRLQGLRGTAACIAACSAGLEP